MPVETIYTLEESNITISGGGQLSGISQGNGSHLAGLTITLDTNAWETVDVLDTDTSFDDSDSSQSLDSAITYDGVSYASGLRVESEYSLTLQDPDGNTYTVYGFNINEPGVTSFSTVEGLAFLGGVGEFPPIGVPLTVIGTTEGPSTAYDDLATPICFARGTMIATPSGPSAVEDLSQGDMVNTLHDGDQAIRWIGSTKISQSALQHNPALLPVRVTAGALGQGLPFHDIHVSRQHRFLISSRVVQRVFGTKDVLIPAHKLTTLPGIYLDETVSGVEYFHFLFDQHQVVFAQGAPTESLFTGPEALKAVSTEARKEILTLFPQLSKKSYKHPSARPIASGKKLNKLINRHVKNGRLPLDTYEGSEQAYS